MTPPIRSMDMKTQHDATTLEVNRQVMRATGQPALRMLTLAFLLAWSVPVITIFSVSALVSAGRVEASSFEADLKSLLLIVALAGAFGLFIGRRVMTRLLRRLTDAQVTVEHHEAMKTASIANVAYELRSPLAAVQVSLKNLIDGLMGTMTAPQLKVVRDCHDTIGRLTRLATDLIEITGFGKERPQLERREVVLQDLLRELVARHDETLRAHTLTLSLRVPEQPVALLGDRAKLTQALDALIDHAVRWSWTGSAIAIELQPVPVGWQLSIDHDIASDRSDFARTMDTFRRLGDSPENQMGLGLQLAHDIVEMHLGRFWMEGEPGRHNRMMITLPSLSQQQRGNAAAPAGRP